MKLLNDACITKAMFFVITLLSCLASPGMAQQPLQGKVIAADGTPLSGATIEVKNSNQRVATDQNGGFTINAAAGETLIVTYIGYRTQEVPVGSQRTLTIRLE